MNGAISLNAFVNFLQFTSAEEQAWIDKQAGAIFVHVPDTEEPQPQSTLGSQRYEPLPILSDEDESRFARLFCERLAGPEHRQRLQIALSSANAMDSFQNAVYRCRLAHEWFRFRDMQLVNFARAWLESRGIRYLDDIQSDEG